MNRTAWLVAALVVAGSALGLGGVVLWRHTHPKVGEDEDTVIARFGEMRAHGDSMGALNLLTHCALSNRKACRCADLAGEYAVDIGQFGQGWTAVSHSHCENTARHIGERAELYAARGVDGEARAEAERALAFDAKEPHANFALAWALSKGGFSPRALEAAETAVAQGRGTPAVLLLATLRSAAGDGPGARKAIEQAAEQAPSDPRVNFDLGVVEQTAGHYREAREAYLKALAANPKFADARYNLAVLAHSIHADVEARHDLDEFSALSPGDPRAAALRAQLAGDAGP
jgi:tetratricopeptide (TPR) repeat protein